LSVPFDLARSGQFTNIKHLRLQLKKRAAWTSSIKKQLGQLMCCSKRNAAVN